LLFTPVVFAKQNTQYRSELAGGDEKKQMLMANKMAG
jgi:hypothetical protein